ncbi:MAG: hypothetical protein ACTHJI_08990 [Leifsonia sp.]
MAIDYVGTAVTLLSTVAASVGAYLSARFGWKHRTQAEEAERRRTTAESILERLVALRDMLREAEHAREVTAWREAIEGVYDVLDDARHRLPAGFLHVKRSIRAAVGEATGLAFTDFRPRSRDDEEELATYNYEWTNSASDYLDVVVDAVRAWREAGARTAEKSRVRSFDGWLAVTGRYVPGGVR